MDKTEDRAVAVAVSIERWQEHFDTAFALNNLDQLADEGHGWLEATPIQPIRQAPRDATPAASEAPG